MFFIITLQHLMHTYTLNVHLEFHKCQLCQQNYLLQLLVTENTYCWGSKRQVHQCVGIGFRVIPCIEGLHNFGAVGVLRGTRDPLLNGLVIQVNKI